MTTPSGGPGRAASFAELVKVVETLRDEVAGLREDLVPRKELRKRWKQAAAIIAAAALVTLSVENTALSGCFLARPKAGSVVRTACGYTFPLYGPAMRTGDEQLAQFRGVLAQIPANRATNVEQDHRLDRVEDELNRLKGR